MGIQAFKRGNTTDGHKWTLEELLQEFGPLIEKEVKNGNITPEQHQARLEAIKLWYLEA
jgi:hypothetical protein